MTAGSDNLFPKVIHTMQASDPAAPSDSSWKTYAKPGGIYARSSNAIVGPFAAAGGGSAPASDTHRNTSTARTTTSTSFVDVTGASLTITTGANRVLCSAQCSVILSSSTANLSVGLMVDGTDVLSGNPIVTVTADSTTYKVLAYSFLTDALTAGSHTFKFRWKSNNGGVTATMQASSDASIVFNVVEIA